MLPVAWQVGASCTSSVAWSATTAPALVSRTVPASTLTSVMPELRPVVPTTLTEAEMVSAASARMWAGQGQRRSTGYATIKGGSQGCC